MASHKRKFFKKGQTAPEKRWRRQEQAIRNEERQQERMLKKVPSLGHLTHFATTVFNAPNRERKVEAAIATCQMLSSHAVPALDDLAHSNILTILVESLGQENPLLQLEAANAVKDIAYASPEHSLQIATSGAVPLLAELIVSPYYKVCEQAVCALVNIIAESPSLRDFIVNHGVVEKLIYLLGHNEIIVQKSALLCLANIATGSDEQIQVLLNHNVMSCMPALLSHSKESVRCEALWFLFKIASGNAMQKQAVVDAGLLPKVAENLRIGRAALKTPGFLTICVLAINSNRNFLLSLIRLCVIPGLCDLLGCQDDTTVTYYVLFLLGLMLGVDASYAEEVAGIIQFSEGLRKIQALLNHADVDVHQLARQLIWQYFSDNASNGTQI
uniref:Importin subunit alpha-4 n=1 Tax=Drosophila rhopaloa TaxID=1041015 RepID=A0A6P4F7L9_DRORH